MRRTSAGFGVLIGIGLAGLVSLVGCAHVGTTGGATEGTAAPVQSVPPAPSAAPAQSGAPAQAAPPAQSTPPPQSTPSAQPAPASPAPAAPAPVPKTGEDRGGGSQGAQSSGQASAGKPPGGGGKPSGSSKKSAPADGSSTITPSAPASTPPASAAPTSASSANPAPKSAAALDLSSLEQRLRDTRAIGVFTKLSLKNQVDDLLADFRAFHKKQTQKTLLQLRQQYDGLLLKVLSLLQDGDPVLAAAISSSREAIWGILTDPEKFSKI
jgi:hypothetical protein